MIIQEKQLEVFKLEALKKFEDGMVEHVKMFFPNHFISMKEEGTRNTIKLAMLRSDKYGLNTQRNVCLYLNNMLILGSYFDLDPMYDWASLILNDKTIQSPSNRIDKLSDIMLETFARIRGPQYRFINKALLNLSNHSDEILQRILNCPLNDIHSLFKSLYPEKYEVVGEINLNKLIILGKEKSLAYGFTNTHNIVMFTTFMFLMGAGFDKDTQFAWANEVLNVHSDVMDQNRKAKQMFEKALLNLSDFLNQYKID